MVPITAEQIREGWREIHREEEKQRADLEARHQQTQQVKKNPAVSPEDEGRQPVAAAHRQQDASQDSKRQKKGQSAPAASKRQQSTANIPPATAAKPTMIASVSTVLTLSSPPAQVLEEDDELDRL